MHLFPIVLFLTVCSGFSTAIYQCPDGSFTNLSVGGARTRLLRTDRVQEGRISSPFQTFRTYNVQGSITAIEALSQSPSLEVGGCAKITGGGVGWSFVIIYFQADEGHEINYNVKIWGN